MKELRHYLRLYSINVSRSIVARMEYKSDLFIGIFGFLIENIATLCSIYFIIRSIPSLAGWNLYQMGFLYGFTMLPIAVDHLLTDELWVVAYFRVKNGDLDRYFLRPVPILFQVIAETFQPEALGEAIVGIVMLVLCGMKCRIHWNISMVVLVLTATFFGAAIVTSIKIITASPAFIIKKSGYLMQIMYNFRDYTRYPISIYPKVMRLLMLFIFPFGLIISLPVEVLMFEKYNPWMLSGAIVLMAMIFLTIACAVWNVCVKRYESTGS